MAAVNEKPRALVLGHSFVRRLKDFAAQNHSNGPYDLNLGLSDVCSIVFLGIGGRTVDKLIRNDLDKIRSAAPNIVVLELGSNDLCDKDSDPETIALSIVALAELLITELSLRIIAVCEVTARQNEPFEIRPFTEAIGEPFYEHCPKSSIVKLNFPMLDYFLLVEFGTFLLLSNINLTGGTEHPVF